MLSLYLFLDMLGGKEPGIFSLFTPPVSLAEAFPPHAVIPNVGSQYWFVRQFSWAMVLT